MGNAYKHGRGVIKDEEKANEWRGKAAEQGLVSVQYKMRLQYWFARRMKENKETATRRFALAAEAGHAKAIKLFDSWPVSETKRATLEPSGATRRQSENHTTGDFGNRVAKQRPDQFTIQVLAARGT